MSQNHFIPSPNLKNSLLKLFLDASHIKQWIGQEINGKKNDARLKHFYSS